MNWGEIILGWLVLFAAPVLAVLLIVYVPNVHGHETDPVWWVWAKWPKDTAWVVMAPAMSYNDCVDRMLPKVRLHINKTTAWDQPKFKCEVR